MSLSQLSVDISPSVTCSAEAASFVVNYRLADGMNGTSLIGSCALASATRTEAGAMRLTWDVSNLDQASPAIPADAQIQSIGLLSGGDDSLSSLVSSVTLIDGSGAATVAAVDR